MQWGAAPSARTAQRNCEVEKCGHVIFILQGIATPFLMGLEGREDFIGEGSHFCEWGTRQRFPRDIVSLGAKTP